MAREEVSPDMRCWVLPPRHLRMPRRNAKACYVGSADFPLLNPAPPLEFSILTNVFTVFWVECLPLIRLHYFLRLLCNCSACPEKLLDLSSEAAAVLISPGAPG